MSRKAKIKFLVIGIVTIFTIMTLTSVSSEHIKLKYMNYILLWTDALSHPFYSQLGIGQEGFRKRQCLFQNCFVTNDKYYFSDITKFDVILFLNKELSEFTRVPKVRTDEQLYVFVALDNSDQYYRKTYEYDNFFNLTWTFKLDSDFYLGTMVIKNRTGFVIGPRKEMHWMDPIKMRPINKNIKKRLEKKNICAVWFPTKCNTQSKRETYALELQNQLKSMFHLELRIVGKCGGFMCPDPTMKNCMREVADYYYFYLAFEKALYDDYVTEDVVYALNNFAVPIVFGGANYSRFLPFGAYINAMEMTPKKVAIMLNNIIRQKLKYYDFFKWRRYYSYLYASKSFETDVFCRFCEGLNNITLRKQRRVYSNFYAWWNRHSSEHQNNTFNAIVEYPPSRKIMKIRNPNKLLSRYLKGYEEEVFVRKLLKEDTKSESYVLAN